MAISEREINLTGGVMPESPEPAETPEEKLAHLAEAIFDFKGHSSLYARFVGKDGQVNYALLGAAKDEEHKPRIEAQIVRGSFSIETELEDSVLEVNGLALVDAPEEPLAPLYREVNGAEPVEWVEVNTWVVCVPLGNSASHDFKLRASLPRVETVQPEDAAAFRMVFASFAERMANKR